MSQPTAKATGRRTPQTKAKQVATNPTEGMVVSINMMDRSAVDELLDSPKVLVASPKDIKVSTPKETKVAAPKDTKTKSPGGDKTNGSTSKDEPKVPTEMHQNGSGAEKKGENGTEKTPEVTNGEGKVRESPRQKAKEQEKKVEQSEAKKVEVEKKLEAKVEKKPEAKVEKKSEQKKPEEKKKTELNASTTSLVKEKELKGFPEDVPESTAVKLDEGTFDSPRPNKTPGKGLKGPAGSLRARISPFRMNDGLQNVSTIVNLSTVSEQSDEVVQSPDQSFGSLRHISGRRSLRNLPARDYTFQSSQRESYRKLADDDSFDYRSPVASVKGRKRELTPTDSDDDIRIVDKTPQKRARLDLSSFLGFMVSPVTRLRNEFRKARIQSSTPNQSFVAVEDVGKEATEQPEDVNDSKEMTTDGDNLKKSIELGQEANDDMELLKDKIEDVEMVTPLQVRRACNIM